MKLQKIQEEFKPAHRRDEYNAGVGRDTLSQAKFDQPGSRMRRFGGSSAQGFQNSGVEGAGNYRGEFQ